MRIDVKLKEILAEKKLNQKDLAKLSKVSENSVSSWIGGGNISLFNLEKICKALNVPINYFEEDGILLVAEEPGTPYRKKCEMCEVKDKLIAALELNNQMLLNELRKYDPGFEAKEAS